MSRINLDPLLTHSDGSYLVISTQYSVSGDFSCALYRAVVGKDDCAAFQVVSNHFAASTCINAQESAYGYALRLYPSSAETIKKPPYLIWSGPRSLSP